MKEREDPSAIISTRAAKVIDVLYALIVHDANGREGVLRRDTPYGTQPWITDDESLARGAMLRLAREEYPDSDQIIVAEFRRV